MAHRHFYISLITVYAHTAYIEVCYYAETALVGLLISRSCYNYMPLLDSLMHDRHTAIRVNGKKINISQSRGWAVYRRAKNNPFARVSERNARRAKGNFARFSGAYLGAG